MKNIFPSRRNKQATVPVTQNNQNLENESSTVNAQNKVQEEMPNEILENESNKKNQKALETQNKDVELPLNPQ